MFGRLRREGKQANMLTIQSILVLSFSVPRSAFPSLDPTEFVLEIGNVSVLFLFLRCSKDSVKRGFGGPFGNFRRDRAFR